MHKKPSSHVLADQCVDILSRIALRHHQKSSSSVGLREPGSEVRRDLNLELTKFVDQGMRAVDVRRRQLLAIGAHADHPILGRDLAIVNHVATFLVPDASDLIPLDDAPDAA